MDVPPPVLDDHHGQRRRFALAEHQRGSEGLRARKEH
jgi:hypothetical protein